MKKILILLLLPFALCAQTVTFVPTAPDVRGHAAILPASYNDTTKTWPTIIFLHGSGERGSGSLNDLKKTIANGPAKVLKDGKFLILCPQTNSWSWRTVKTLRDPVTNTTYKVKVNDANKFVEWALQHYRIDPKRVYITGLSMGGEGVWFAMADNPSLYAAGAPVCGRASRTEGGTVQKGGVKVWAFHGDADKSIGIQAGLNPILGMRTAGGSPTWTVYPGVGHNCWDVTYKNMALYPWFLKYTR